MKVRRYGYGNGIAATLGGKGGQGFQSRQHRFNALKQCRYRTRYKVPTIPACRRYLQQYTYRLNFPLYGKGRRNTENAIGPGNLGKDDEKNAF